jgi:hypothetical protein
MTETVNYWNGFVIKQSKQNKINWSVVNEDSINSYIYRYLIIECRVFDFFFI